MNIIICGGGTGGHLYPGIELAKHYASKGHKIIYIASLNGVDEQILREQNLQNIDIKYWNLKGINRKKSISSLCANLKNGIKLLNLFVKSRKLLKKEEINFVVGVGGYISYPVVLQACKLKIPTMIHEQNSYPGLVNRTLSKKVDIIGVCYDSAKNFFDEGLQDKIIKTSNPRVNKTFPIKGHDFSQELKLPPKKKILFLGGSLGSDKINELFCDVSERFNINEYCFILIGGLLNQVQEAGTNSVVIEHTSKILEYISSSDLIISRGGATTLLEIIYLEKKSIVIPSPNVVANHQYLNAHEFEKDNLTKIILEKDVTVDILEKEIISSLENEEQEKSLREFSKLDSLYIFDEILEDMHENNNQFNQR